MKISFKVLLTILATLYHFAVFSSAPFTHVYLASLWLDQEGSFNKAERQAFLVGTLFPDIRYLGELERSHTHISNVNIETIRQAKSPFEAGMMMHAYVDELHAVFLSENDLNPLLKDLPPKRHDFFIKLIVDQLIYPKNSWAEALYAVLFVDDEELERGASYYNARKWHSFLFLYMSMEPATTLTQLTYVDKGFFQTPSEVLDVWAVQLPLISKESKAKDYVEGFIEFFKKSIQM